MTIEIRKKLTKVIVTVSRGLSKQYISANQMQPTFIVFIHILFFGLKFHSYLSSSSSRCHWVACSL